jgi:hypothetical protein
VTGRRKNDHYTITEEFAGAMLPIDQKKKEKFIDTKPIVA